jgi:hypothetical protein
MYWLAIHCQPVLESDLVKDVFDLSPKEVREALNSLLGRCLIESTREGLTLQNVVMEYVNGVLIGKLINQLEGCNVNSV